MKLFKGKVSRFLVFGLVFIVCFFSEIFFGAGAFILFFIGSISEYLVLPYIQKWLKSRSSKSKISEIARLELKLKELKENQNQ